VLLGVIALTPGGNTKYAVTVFVLGTLLSVVQQFSARSVARRLGQCLLQTGATLIPFTADCLLNKKQGS